MPREHFDITMTPKELHDFLASFNRLVVATNDRDGGTWADGAAYHFEGGRLYFRVPQKTRTLANIRTDDRVCCVVESLPAGASYYNIRAALVHGRAEELTGGQAPAITASLASVPDPVDGTPADGPIFSVGLEDVVSFVFAKIQYRYEDRPDL
jgi:nitroimidazol reductase NimA-like FMN-containing flavoprotein (pyridoxamine 5'-phosphate oxidase superfamily)